MPKVRVDPGCAGSPPGLQDMASGEQGPVMMLGDPHGKGRACWFLGVMRGLPAEIKEAESCLREQGQEQDERVLGSPVSSPEGI